MNEGLPSGAATREHGVELQRRATLGTLDGPCLTALEQESVSSISIGVCVPGQGRPRELELHIFTGKSTGCPAFLPVVRGREESRPCNHIYIPRKLRLVPACRQTGAGSFTFLSSSWINRSISSRSSGSKVLSERRLFRASNCCWQRYSSQDKAIYQVLTDFCGSWIVYSQAKSALLRLVLMGVFVQSTRHFKVLVWSDSTSFYRPIGEVEFHQLSLLDCSQQSSSLPAAKGVQKVSGLER